jgi:hypothetical protein
LKSDSLNFTALIAVLVFAGVLLAIFGTLYYGAVRSRSHGEIDNEGVVILRWALLGYVIIYALLAITTFLT